MDTSKIKRASFLEILKRIGPGIILAGVVIGPGNITTSAMMEANYGYQMIWLIAYGYADDTRDKALLRNTGGTDYGSRYVSVVLLLHNGKHYRFRHGLELNHRHKLENRLTVHDSDNTRLLFC